MPGRRLRMSRRLHGAPRGPHGAGSTAFTLIELVLVLTLLVLVLSTTYRMVVDALDAERRLETITLPEKVGEGLLTNFRRDLQGVFFRNMGRRVFLVIDGGTGDQSRDELSFLSTVEPTPVPDPDNAYSSFQTVKLHTLTGINYFLRKTSRNDGLDAYTLYRKEIVDFDPIEPLQGRGVAYELYDKVAYLSIECFDGWSWYTDWNSEIRIETEEADLLAMQEGETGVARVTQPRASPSALAAAPGVDPATGAPTEILPPSAVPVAIRIELGVYVSTAGRVLRDVEGNPVLKRYATVVQIPSSQRIPLPEAGGGLSPDGTTVTGDGGPGGAEPVTQVRGQNVRPGQDGRGGAPGGGRGFGGGGGGGGRGGAGRLGGGGRGGGGGRR